MNILIVRKDEDNVRLLPRLHCRHEGKASKNKPAERQHIVGIRIYRSKANR